ncbi:hypothetical protein XENOCAPTIV_017319 [Xenoophorus captivus]|uniref:Uncharacterized protein n=1 Tax=Xenoophorus captivus TaxID=1517983 RepID=A0ABV0QB52_9TELE
MRATLRVLRTAAISSAGNRDGSCSDNWSSPLFLKLGYFSVVGLFPWSHLSHLPGLLHPGDQPSWDRPVPLTGSVQQLRRCFVLGVFVGMLNGGLCGCFLRSERLVPSGGRIYRHHPGCEVPEGEGSARSDRRIRRQTIREENRAHGERNRDILPEGQRHETEEALKGFDFLASPEELDGSEPRSGEDSGEWGEIGPMVEKGLSARKGPNRSKLQDMLANLRDTEELPPMQPALSPPCRPIVPRLNEHEVGRPEDEPMTFLPSTGKSFILGRVDEAVSNELGLGELAGLTVANEAENLGYDVSKTT